MKVIFSIQHRVEDHNSYFIRHNSQRVILQGSLIWLPCLFMERRLIYAHLALFIVALVYGLNYIIAKDVMVGGYLHPFTFILLRVVTATFLLWITDLLLVRDKVDKKDLPYLALCGLFGVAANQLLFFSGLKLTSPIHASLIMTCSPVLVLVMAQIFLKEKAYFKENNRDYRRYGWSYLAYI